MRWFVSRNGQTTGPVEESEVAAWVRGGMADASVRDEAGGNWMPIQASPFAGLLPPDPAAKTRQVNAVIILLVLVGLPIAFLWYACSGYKESSQKADQAFCAKNLDYYEKFCAAYPANCTEGARRLAKCDP